MKVLSSLIFAWLALCAASPTLAAPPDNIRAVYDVYKDSLLVGRIEEAYHRDHERYTLSSTTIPVGLLAVFKPEKMYASSDGQITANGLQPLHFSHRREQDNSKDSNAEFDWAAGRVTLTRPTQRETLPLPPGTQDRLSAMYQFMFLSLRNTPALDFTMTNGHKLDSYHYTVAPGPALDTPAGKLDTLHLDSGGKAGERRTEIWLAVQRHFLPCKMVITEPNGDRLIQILGELALQP